MKIVLFVLALFACASNARRVWPFGGNGNSGASQPGEGSQEQQLEHMLALYQEQMQLMEAIQKDAWFQEKGEKMKEKVEQLKLDPQYADDPSKLQVAILQLADEMMSDPAWEENARRVAEEVEASRRNGQSPMSSLRTLLLGTQASGITDREASAQEFQNMIALYREQLEHAQRVMQAVQKDEWFQEKGRQLKQKVEDLQADPQYRDDPQKLQAAILKLSEKMMADPAWEKNADRVAEQVAARRQSPMGSLGNLLLSQQA
jgi:hypothetical protein